MLITTGDPGGFDSPTVFFKRAPNWGWRMEGPFHISQSWPIAETASAPPALLGVDDPSLPNQSEEVDRCLRAATAFFAGPAEGPVAAEPDAEPGAGSDAGEGGAGSGVGS